MVVINNINKNVDHKKTKITKGSQKIEIKKLEDKNSLQVTFSKRRSGLFNKAMELSVLCGVEVGIVVFSPNGKMFVIGCWWDESIDKMRLEELEEYVKGLMKLRLTVASRISEMMMKNHCLMPLVAATMVAIATGLDVLPINNNGFVVDGNSNSVCGFDDRFTQHLRM
ncbi:hypothetical protein EZV62_027348 [Acer yangbiense]|uniref:MADS-box domain-containing protein n=1 Tax=Acer yangbiense TaxID=1000413 RepID=A0A5C7GTF3_9ROSI|nr:hypothetical protein EZV62_027348 [Acer yangbiense]